MRSAATAFSLSFVLSVSSCNISILDFAADSGLSGFIFETSVLHHYENLTSVLSCAALCGANEGCQTYSYNTEVRFCRIYNDIFCNKREGIYIQNTFFYVYPGPVGIVGRVSMKCKVSKQIATEFTSGRAIDGKWLPNVASKSCSSTLRKDYPWWWVDLVYLYKVHSVVILNRGSKTVYGRLSKVQVYVGRTLDTLDLCAYREEVVPKGQTAEIKCEPAPVKGRYVKIALDKLSQKLSMCEMAVNAERILS